MSRKLKLTILVSFLCLLFVGNVKAFDVVSPTSDFYVNDYAGVLNEEVKDYIMDQSVKLYNQNGVQIVVLTINDLEGIPLEEYANKYYNDNGIGNKGTDGVLIIFSLIDREIRIEVGDHMEGIIPDGKAGRLIDTYAFDYFKNNNWNEGIRRLYDGVYQEIVNSDSLTITRSDNTEEEVEDIFWTGVVLSWFFGYISVYIKKYFDFGFLWLIVTEYILLSSKISIAFKKFLILAALYTAVFLIAKIAGVLSKNFKGSSFGGGYSSSYSGSSFSGGGSFSSGGHSFSSHSGGGGHSSGGGASRKF